MRCAKHDATHCFDPICRSLQQFRDSAPVDTNPPPPWWSRLTTSILRSAA